MKEYNDLCLELSTVITQRYSTSFTRGIKTLHKRFHNPIYAVYGFVRLADEIVDTFHEFDKKTLLEKFRNDFDNKAKELFNEDLELASQFGVRGFPTIFFIDEDDNRFKVYGSKPYQQYESALLKLVPDAEIKNVSPNINDLFDRYNSITVQELAVVQNTSLPDAKNMLENLFHQGNMEKINSKNGPLYKVKNV